jgi:hypothetical protein
MDGREETFSDVTQKTSNGNWPWCAGSGWPVPGTRPAKRIIWTAHHLGSGMLHNKANELYGRPPTPTSDGLARFLTIAFDRNVYCVEKQTSVERSAAHFTEQGRVSLVPQACTTPAPADPVIFDRPRSEMQVVSTTDHQLGESGRIPFVLRPARPTNRSIVNNNI